VRGVYKTDYPSYAYPVVLQSAAAVPVTVGIAPSPAIYPPPVPLVSTLTQTDFSGAAIVGFEAAIELTKQLAVVPEVRVLTFKSNSSGQGVFLARPGVGVRWSF
jgi:hypothetical protein